MRKFSTLFDLIIADIRESNARNKKSRNQRQDITFRTLLKQSMRSKKGMEIQARPSPDKAVQVKHE